MVDFNYRSMHTLLIYLNTCDDGGGGTRFYTDNQVTTLRPDESGRWVSFPIFIFLNEGFPSAGRGGGIAATCICGMPSTGAPFVIPLRSLVRVFKSYSPS